MDIRELGSFVVLAEQLHFGRAAELLNMSQPALTKQIRRLEEDLGGPLFERGRRGTRLSAFGDQVLESARPLVAGMAALRERSRQAARGDAGRIRIGFGFHTFDVVPRLIVRLRRQSPQVEVTLRDMSTSEQV